MFGHNTLWTEMVEWPVVIQLDYVSIRNHCLLDSEVRRVSSKHWSSSKMFVISCHARVCRIYIVQDTLCSQINVWLSLLPTLIHSSVGKS